MDVSDDEDVRAFRGGQYTRPAEGRLTEHLSDGQSFEPVYGDDFSGNTTEMSYEEFVREREKDWGDPNDAFDMSLVSTPKENGNIATGIAEAAVELAVGGTQVAPSSGGGGGNDDEWWERERQRAKQNEWRPRKKGRH